MSKKELAIVSVGWFLLFFSFFTSVFYIFSASRNPVAIAVCPIVVTDVANKDVYLLKIHHESAPCDPAGPIVKVMVSTK